MPGTNSGAEMVNAVIRKSRGMAASVLSPQHEKAIKQILSSLLGVVLH